MANRGACRFVQRQTKDVAPATSIHELGYQHEERVHQSKENETLQQASADLSKQNP